MTHARKKSKNEKFKTEGSLTMQSVLNELQTTQAQLTESQQTLTHLKNIATGELATAISKVSTGSLFLLGKMTDAELLNVVKTCLRQKPNLEEKRSPTVSPILTSIPTHSELSFVSAAVSGNAAKMDSVRKSHTRTQSMVVNVTAPDLTPPVMTLERKQSEKEASHERAQSCSAQNSTLLLTQRFAAVKPLEIMTTPHVTPLNSPAAKSASQHDLPSLSPAAEFSENCFQVEEVNTAAETSTANIEPINKPTSPRP